MSRSPIEDEVQKGEFRWTGHALIDMGIASLLAFAGLQKPEELTSKDL